MGDDDTKGRDDVVAALEECEHKVDQLERENEVLRDASRTFGALAERLNATLATERRQNRERRAHPRATEDRRRGEPVVERTRR